MLASTGLMARWGSLHPGQHKKQHIWRSDVFYFRGGGVYTVAGWPEVFGVQEEAAVGISCPPLGRQSPMLCSLLLVSFYCRDCCLSPRSGR